MENSAIDPHELLLFALEEYGIKVLSNDGKHVVLNNGYSIETEGADLWKLSEGGSVIGPFTDVDELCAFVQRSF
jgi:hypothetical protein